MAEKIQVLLPTFLIEWKILFSIGILHFQEGSREAFHNHAFNAITFWLSGDVTE